MTYTKNKIYNITVWAVRIVSVIIIAVGLPFYFGYGNILPFANSSYTLADNIWLIVIPLVFIGLALGIRFTKTGGYIVTLSILAGTVLSFILQGNAALIMLIPFVAGIINLMLGYKVMCKLCKQ